MFRDYMKTRLAVFLAVLVLPGGLVAGVCLTPEQATDPDDMGFATAVQVDQGQGSIDCTAFIGQQHEDNPSGVMFEVEVGKDKLVSTAVPYDPILWSVDNSNHNVDVLFIGNSDGSRCTQFYKGNARSGFAAAGTKTNKNATVVACTDGFSEPEPPPAPVLPVSTADGCTDTGDLELQAAINDNPKYDVVIAIGRGAQGDNTAICSDQDQLVNQSRCVDQCITPESDSPVPYDPNDGACVGDGPFFPLKCRACELSSVIDSDPFSNDDPQFCWEVLQKVDLDDPQFDPSGSFKKAPGPKSNQVWNVREYAGSICYQISGTTDSGYRYSYFVPAGCTP